VRVEEKRESERGRRKKRVSVAVLRLSDQGDGDEGWLVGLPWWWWRWR
jgi:hypothetical protein